MYIRIYLTVLNYIQGQVDGQKHRIFKTVNFCIPF